MKLQHLLQPHNSQLNKLYQDTGGWLILTFLSFKKLGLTKQKTKVPSSDIFSFHSCGLVKIVFFQFKKVIVK